MLQRALRPKWLGLLALALVLAAICAWLGTWQLDRARADGDARVEPTGQAVPLRSLLAPQEGLTAQIARQPVEASGELDLSEPLRVADRSLDGADGEWVLVAMRVRDGDAGETAQLPVVLGWQPAGSDLVPAERIAAGGLSTVSGFLRPPEEPGGTPRDGVAQTVSSADLLNVWGSPIYSAFLMADDETATAFGLRAVPPLAEGRGPALQNLSYALQWFLFASFAVALWWRMLRDEHLDSLAVQPVQPPIADRSTAP